MLSIALSALILCSCTAPRFPVVSIEYVGEFSEDEQARVWAGAAAWRELDYGLAPLDGDPDYIVVVERADLGGEYGGLSSTSRPLILIDADRLDLLQLQRISAHEFGHTLLPTSEHGERGVMASPPTNSSLMSDDLAIACRAAGRGC